MLTLPDHAKLKMRQRNLSEQMVREVLENPDRVFPSYGNRLIAEKNLGKLNLRVVFVKEGNTTVVITVHWVGQRR